MMEQAGENHPTIWDGLFANLIYVPFSNSALPAQMLKQLGSGILPVISRIPTFSLNKK
ncbi:MAG: hypothetical protein AB7P14_18365 [Blastocatellales bacterium]